MATTTVEETQQRLLEAPDIKEDDNPAPFVTKDGTAKEVPEAKAEMAEMRARLERAEQIAGEKSVADDTLRYLQAQNAELAKRLTDLSNDASKHQAKTSRAEVKAELGRLHSKRRAAERAEDDETFGAISADISELERALLAADKPEPPAQGTHDVEALINQIEQRRLVSEAAAFRAEHQLTEAEISAMARRDADLDRDPMWRLVAGRPRWTEVLRREREAQKPASRRPAPGLSAVEAPSDAAGAGTQLSASQRDVARKLGVTEAAYAKEFGLLGGGR